MVGTRAFIRESNAIEAVYEEAAVEKSLEAWTYLTSVEELTHEALQRGHELLLEDRQPEIAGTYRDTQVYVGDETPPPPMAVEGEMTKLLGWTPADPLAAVSWHVAFEQIHPFADGNGRIGRLLYLWHCRQQLDSEPLFWREDDRQGYYALFDSRVDVSAYLEQEPS